MMAAAFALASIAGTEVRPRHRRFYGHRASPSAFELFVAGLASTPCRAALEERRARG